MGKSRFSMFNNFVSISCYSLLICVLSTLVYFTNSKVLLKMLYVKFASNVYTWHAIWRMSISKGSLKAHLGLILGSLSFVSFSQLNCVIWVQKCSQNVLYMKFATNMYIWHQFLTLEYVLVCNMSLKWYYCKPLKTKNCSKMRTVQRIFNPIFALWSPRLVAMENTIHFTK